jgi:hypothetical protein
MRWDSTVNINGLGPLVHNPARPSPRTRARHRVLLELLLEAGDLGTIRKILAAYPYLVEEYAGRNAKYADRIAGRLRVP